MSRRTFHGEVWQSADSTATAVEIPFDPREVFGKIRAPVLVTIGDHTFSTTLARMGGKTFIPLNRANRAAAGVASGERTAVTLELDTAPRTVSPPAELAEVLAAEPELAAAWDALSFTQQRESAESIAGAKRPETRQRRLAKILTLLRGRP